MNYIVATESGCDLSLEVCRERGIHVLFMKYTMDHGNTLFRKTLTMHSHTFRVD